MCGIAEARPATDLVTLYTPEVKRPSPYVVVCLIAWGGGVEQTGFCCSFSV